MTLTTTIRTANDPQFDADTITATLSNGAELRIYVYASSRDDVPVIQIDTNTDGGIDVGRFRIALNDGYVWDADAELPLRAHDDEYDGLTLVNVRNDA